MATAPTPTVGPVPDPADPPLQTATGSAPVSPPAAERRRAWGRLPAEGMLGGVCAGIARVAGIDALVVRIVMVSSVVVGGVGIGIYALAWALMPVAPDMRGRGGPTPKARLQGVVIAILTLSAVLMLRRAGVTIASPRFSPLGARFWPLVLGVCGVALVWRSAVGVPPSEDGRRPTLLDHLRHARRITVPRIAVGGLLVAFASASVLHAIGTLHSLGAAIGAVAIVTSMLTLLFGPWFLRLGRSLASERSARIREQERAELAAHLHDSVLQTLALIQNRATDAQQVAALARRQERELRRWLFDRIPAGGDSIKAVMERAAAEVEELHGVPIEVVIVGDGPVDARLEALVQAAREAMTNAAKFAGSDRIDLYAEVGKGRVEAFVRDRGVGFDPAAIPDDRRGVRDSIIARMQRHGGRGIVHSSPGEGTEVELAMGATGG